MKKASVITRAFFSKASILSTIVIVMVLCTINVSAQQEKSQNGVIQTSYAKASQVRQNSLWSTRDSALQAVIKNDSLKIEHQYAEKARWQKLLQTEEFPVINAGKHSGVFPVSGITEVPDPHMQYKLLFEVTQRNPDSLLKMPDFNFVEVAREINLHVASGIPLKNVSVVIVVHGDALNSISNNSIYYKRFKMNNPNLKLIQKLEKLGVRFIACGQAMSFLNISKEDLLPEVRVSLTAQTALSGYQLKGYVLKTLRDEDK